MHIYPPTSSYNAALLGDDQAEDIFSGERILGHLLAYEIVLTRSLAAAGVITTGCSAAIIHAIKQFVPDQCRLTEAGMVDGVIVPELVRQLRSGIKVQYRSDFHSGATSQDLVDTAMVIALLEHASLLENRFAGLIDALTGLGDEHGDTQVMGVTRMQSALTVDVGHRIENWRAPLQVLANGLAGITKHLAVLQFGGPVGDRSGLAGQSDIVAGYLAGELGLADPGHAWHTDRGRILDYGTFCSRIAVCCGKIGKDITLMARDGTLRLSGCGTSSSMPGKSNPIAAEILVTLATYCSSLLPALNISATQEMERSGSMWTLEWIVLPQLCVMSSKALALATRAIDQIEHFKTVDEAG